MIHPIQTVDPALHSVDPFESLDMCPISDDLFPSDEVFLESLIQSDLLLDVGSVVNKSNPDLLNKPDISFDRSPSIGLVESLRSPFKPKFGDPDEFDFSYRFLNSYDTEFVPIESISPIDFSFLMRLSLLIINPQSLAK